MLKTFSQKARREERFQKPSLMMGRKYKNVFYFSTAVPCILVLSKSFIYQLMHNKDALEEY
jgi:hypothetical protein